MANDQPRDVCLAYISTSTVCLFIYGYRYFGQEKVHKVKGLLGAGDPIHPSLLIAMGMSNACC